VKERREEKMMNWKKEKESVVEGNREMKTSAGAL
jgi:hypothetical protein